MRIQRESVLMWITAVTACSRMIGSERLILCVFVMTGVLSQTSILFSCSFEQSTCGMDNQRGLPALWKRRYLFLGNRSGFAVAVNGNESGNRIARFVTPDFDTRGAESGCLTFLYFIAGRTPASLACIKQGFVTRYIFATARKTRGHWEKADVNVTFLGDTVMLYFEADTKEYGNSIVAFTDVKVTKRPCSYKAPKARRRSR